MEKIGLFFIHNTNFYKRLKEINIMLISIFLLLIFTFSLTNVIL